MLKGKLFPKATDVQVNNKDVAPFSSFYELHAVQNNETALAMSDYKGKKVLIVNTASDCGYTGQYDELEQLHRKYKDLVILGFPANDFKEQEKKDDKAIAEFCKINYGVTFTLVQKAHVVAGPDQHAVFAWLSHANKNGWCDQPPLWNFCKYLVDENGKLAGFWSQPISPLDARIVSKL